MKKPPSVADAAAVVDPSKRVCIQRQKTAEGKGREKTGKDRKRPEKTRKRPTRVSSSKNGEQPKRHARGARRSYVHAVAGPAVFGVARLGLGVGIVHVLSVSAHTDAHASASQGQGRVGDGQRRHVGHANIRFATLLGGGHERGLLLLLLLTPVLAQLHTLQRNAARHLDGELRRSWRRQQLMCQRAWVRRAREQDTVPCIARPLQKQIQRC